MFGTLLFLSIKNHQSGELKNSALQRCKNRYEVREATIHVSIDFEGINSVDLELGEPPQSVLKEGGSWK